MAVNDKKCKIKKCTFEVSVTWDELYTNRENNWLRSPEIRFNFNLKSGPYNYV